MTAACFYRNWNSEAEFIVGSNLLGLNWCSWRRGAVEYLCIHGCLSVVVMAFKLVKGYSSPLKNHIFI